MLDGRSWLAETWLLQRLDYRSDGRSWLAETWLL